MSSDILESQSGCGTSSTKQFSELPRLGPRKLPTKTLPEAFPFVLLMMERQIHQGARGSVMTLLGRTHRKVIA